MPDLFTTTVAAILTLFVYSYLLRDNPLYRLAEHLLVATSVAYALIVAFHAVLRPRLLVPLQTDAVGRPDLLIPLVLGVLLLSKSVPRGARLGNPSLGFLVGTGLGLAMGGALLGTLIPQARATMLPIIPGGGVTPLDSLSNLIILIGTLTVLFSFLYVRGQQAVRVDGGEGVVPRQPPWRTVGRWFLMVAFGSIFGGLTLTYLSLLVGRLDFLINDWLLRLFGL